MDIPPGAGPVRWLRAQAGQGSYRFYQTLEEARGDPDAVVILEGDTGGQIYVVVPVDAVRCSVSDLQRLLTDLDEISWTKPDVIGRQLRYEHAPAGTGIAGGRGGGASTGDVWVHPRLAPFDEQIREILNGVRTSLDRGSNTRDEA